MDEGPILVQKQVEVLPTDTEDTLAARVMEQELIAYPEALDIMLSRLRGDKPSPDLQNIT